MGKERHSMYSRAGHVTMETVYWQMLALWLGDGDEHRTLESDIMRLNVKGNLYLNLHNLWHSFPSQIQPPWVICDGLPTTWWLAVFIILVYQQNQVFKPLVYFVWQAVTNCVGLGLKSSACGWSWNQGEVLYMCLWPESYYCSHKICMTCHR